MNTDLEQVCHVLGRYGFTNFAYRNGERKKPKDQVKIEIENYR